MATLTQDLLKPLEVILLQLLKIAFKALEQYGYFYSRSTETTRSNIA